MSGRRVLATLGLILLATAVLPPVAAFAVNRARTRAAEATARDLAQTLRMNESRLVELARDADVLCGSGRMPAALSPQAAGWVSASRVAWDAASGKAPALVPDPWGNCYVVDLAAVRALGPAIWIFSAGPDGILDTPIDRPIEGPVGNDLGARIR